MKSKTSASATSTTSIASGMVEIHAQTFSTTTDSMTFATSWHLSVAFLEVLVDVLVLDELADVLLLAEQPRDAGARSPRPPRSRGSRSPARWRASSRALSMAGQQSDRRLHLLAALLQQLAPAAAPRAAALHVVEVHRLGGVLHQVQDVVHARDQPVDVVAVERRDESRVQQRHGVVRDLVGAPFASPMRRIRSARRRSSPSSCTRSATSRPPSTTNSA